ncbi:type VII secretion protein EssB [Halalkalibacter oceani]|uniref:Type VII secretion protein EssB n=1 Tax=Halalkalibacter oceani TaxID=1653776 RepID=A0A9X2DRS1_9BACI|nr:type VII secretion protein EssB [Halalkalibacter oceani]MCM3715931.1 type VII secretion protein EssB [Halalkalibacter oceani]
MEEKKDSYLERQTEAIITKKQEGYVFQFQKAKVKLSDKLEINMLQGLNDPLQRTITESEDVVEVNVVPPKGTYSFQQLKRKSLYSRWLFADQLIKELQSRRFERLTIVVCPENVIIDSSFKPSFLHYGVKESLPPYSKDQEKLFLEMKATIAAAVDDRYSFHEYIHFHQTLKLSDMTRQLFAAKNTEELQEIVRASIHELEQKEQNLIHLPRTKWMIQRYSLWGLVILLLPTICYTVYSFFFIQPEQQAYIKSGEYFLTARYSDVIEQLRYYDPDDMPYVTKYQLATAYVQYEALTGEQRANIQNTLTLQSDPAYFDYWIYVGRGENEEAVDLGRSLGDRDLVMFGLLKYREDIRADDSLSGQEKEEELQLIERELEEYVQEREQQSEEAEEPGNAS